MVDISPAYIAEQIGYLRTDREFYIEFDEFGGDMSDLPELRRLLRRAAKAAGLRVHSTYEDGDDAVWVYDPDWQPTPQERLAFLDAKREAAFARRDAEQAEGTPVRHLRIVE
ncbi:MAG: hypothetical protein EPO52_01515 [Herbiconiux sp.]|uniref:hypothetical protein n=1 Tax=Herbiconiux sp. TaxID=1871186 RepID=UPI00120721F8|nr:hypothetical protein [Herbiconiux sp.]TAJ49665.1 MAG: hypothetical protein EPO52_01515 [Herbiconiux sp.]